MAIACDECGKAMFCPAGKDWIICRCGPPQADALLLSPSDLRRLQYTQPWTVPYSDDFQADPRPHKDLEHALVHITKAAGILFGFVDKADHGTPVWDLQEEEIKKRTADFVMCAIRIANTQPWAKFDLAKAVLARIEEINGRHEKTSETKEGCPGCGFNPCVCVQEFKKFKKFKKSSSVPYREDF